MEQRRRARGCRAWERVRSGSSGRRSSGESVIERKTFAIATTPSVGVTPIRAPSAPPACSKTSCSTPRYSAQPQKVPKKMVTGITPKANVRRRSSTLASGSPFIAKTNFAPALALLSSVVTWHDSQLSAERPAPVRSTSTASQNWIVKPDRTGHQRTLRRLVDESQHTRTMSASPTSAVSDSLLLSISTPSTTACNTTSTQPPASATVRAVALEPMAPTSHALPEGWSGPPAGQWLQATAYAVSANAARTTGSAFSQLITSAAIR
eukprot:7373674-Prymnesium_polylepis.1